MESYSVPSAQLTLSAAKLRLNLSLFDKMTRYAREGKVFEMKNILDQQPDIIHDKKYDDGRSALIWASRNGHVQAVRLLLNRGATVNELDSYGYSALILASRYGHENVARLLVRYGASINFKCYGGRTALHEACHRGHVSTILVLIEVGANLEIVDKRDKEPLDLLPAVVDSDALYTQLDRILVSPQFTSFVFRIKDC